MFRLAWGFSPREGAVIQQLLWILALAFLSPLAYADTSNQVIWDTRTGKTVSARVLDDQLGQANVVFVGEQHDDPAAHTLELEILQSLHQRAGARLTLAMEMWERDVQPSLDAYLDGTSDETAFLKAARPWSNYPNRLPALS